MEIALTYIINFMVFILGSFFGSFYTLATYRIPRGEDITRERSYCPHCNKKLQWYELVPVFSYIFLRGRCKNCKEKIGIRYIAIEIFTAMIFLAFFNQLNFLEATTMSIMFQKLAIFAVFILFYTVSFLIAFIDKENRYIDESLITMLIAVTIIYAITSYVYMLNTNYIYILIASMILMVLYILLEISKDDSYVLKYYIRLLMYLTLVSIYLSVVIVGFATILFLPIYIIDYMYQRKNKEQADKDKKISRKNKKDLEESKGLMKDKQDEVVYNMGRNIHIPFTLYILTTSVILKLAILAF